jgi:hypothetical protein
MNLDIIMLGGFLNPGAHAALMENVQNTYQGIPWYSAMYHRLKETDVVEESLCGSTRTRRHKKFREALGIDPQDGTRSVDDLQKTFEEANKNRTLDWLSTGFTVIYCDIFNIGILQR